METATLKDRSKRLVTIKASSEWHDWLDGLSSHVARDKSTTIEDALREAARQWGYDRKPPRR